MSQQTVIGVAAVIGIFVAVLIKIWWSSEETPTMATEGRWNAARMEINDANRLLANEWTKARAYSEYRKDLEYLVEVMELAVQKREVTDETLKQAIKKLKKAREALQEMAPRSQSSGRRSPKVPYSPTMEDITGARELLGD